MNKKGAIFTWCYENGTVNIGQILQCYALQRVCNSLGIDTIVIRYRALEGSEKSESIPSKGIDRDAYEDNYKDKHLERQDTVQVKKIKAFINERIVRSEQCYSVEDILEEINDRELLIVGSDQLWNPAWYNSVFLLDFDYGAKRCISYATSGVFVCDETNEADIELIAKKIMKFDYVSVRERISKEILERYMKKDVFNAMDPVMLLKKEEWDQLSAQPMCTKPYVFAFFIGKLEPHKHLLKEVARKYNVEKVLYIKMAKLGFEEVYNDLEIMMEIPDAGIEEFVSLIKHSVAVCTDSFHAFVMSVIYNKPFFLMDRAYMSKTEASNCRWDDVMGRLCIDNRESNSRKEIVMKESIDYEIVNKQMDIYRKKSINWLKKAVDDE